MAAKAATQASQPFCERVQHKHVWISLGLTCNADLKLAWVAAFAAMMNLVASA
jgi:hypothetical protein